MIDVLGDIKEFNMNMAKHKLEDNFPPEEFCRQENCSHWRYIDCIKTNIDIRIVNKTASEGRIKTEREKYCKTCRATRFLEYQAKLS